MFDDDQTGSGGPAAAGCVLLAWFLVIAVLVIAWAIIGIAGIPGGGF
jgi:hypothetical protein